MCGPKFCSMRISADLKDAAIEAGKRQAGTAPDGAHDGLSADEIQAGLRGKADEFREKGGEIYLEEAA